MAYPFQILVVFFFITSIIASIHPTNDNYTSSFITFPIYQVEKIYNGHRPLYSEHLEQQRKRCIDCDEYDYDYDYDYSAIKFYKANAYVVQLKVGSEGRLINLLLDTGSNLIWWLSSSCKNCYDTETKCQYNPLSSHSYLEIPCNSTECVGLNGRSWKNKAGCKPGGPCNVTAPYLDGDAAYINFGYEQVSTEDGTMSRYILFGLANRTRGKKFSKYTHGIMGFGRDNPLSFVQQFKAKKFAMCLKSSRSDPKEPSLLYLYGYPALDNPEGAFVLPLLQNKYNPSLYYVGVTGLWIAGERVDIEPSIWKIDDEGQFGAFIDTGSSITVFPRFVYEVFREAFIKEADAFVPIDEKDIGGFYDTCYLMDRFRSHNHFPRVSISFLNGKKLFLPPQQVLIQINATMSCLAFGTFPDILFTILGSYQLKGTRLSFNLEEKTVMFAPYEC